MIARRQLLFGLASLVAAPAVVRASSLMPVKALPSFYFRHDEEWTVLHPGTSIYRIEYKIVDPAGNPVRNAEVVSQIRCLESFKDAAALTFSDPQDRIKAAALPR